LAARIELATGALTTVAEIAPSLPPAPPPGSNSPGPLPPGPALLSVRVELVIVVATELEIAPPPPLAPSGARLRPLDLDHLQRNAIAGDAASGVAAGSR